MFHISGKYFFFSSFFLIWENILLIFFIIQRFPIFNIIAEYDLAFKALDKKSIKIKYVFLFLCRNMYYE